MDSPTVDVGKISKLADTLSHGLESLVAQLRQQREKETLRRQQAEMAVDQVEPLENSADSGVLADTGNTIVPQEAWILSDSDQVIADALDACKQLKSVTTVNLRPPLRRCPVTNQTTDQEDFEHDFTTPGIQGNLECPFAKMAQNGLPMTPNSTVDPIAVEFHPDKVSVHSHHNVTQASGCPIRFLDKHSPEELAKYFENHKHEIPRSHEICVKRYQQNERSIRELDQKYGSMVNMIQGLGVKHKQYLSEKDRRQSMGNDQDHSSTRAVEQWAHDISDRPEEAVADTDTDTEVEVEHDERVPHFERPLREIRVGESPSRPWGISIPIHTKQPESTPASDRGVEPTSLALSETSLVPPVAPIAVRTGPSNPASKPQEDNVVSNESPDRKTEAVSPARPPRTTFWGPVFFESPSAAGTAAKDGDVHFMGPAFFGWSAERVAAFLRDMK